jgi:molybdate transport system substrate-binding protein
MSLTILSTHAVKDVMDALGAELDHAAGESVSLSYDPANVLKRRIEGGEAFDVAIATRAALETLARQNQVAADTIADLGRSGLGLSVRKGASLPDISTVDAFKRALLTAKSVVRSKDGTSGIYFATLLERLGIGTEMSGKIILGPSGRVAELVAKGDAAMAVQQVSELLPVKEAHYVGPFPEALQLYTMFSAGIGTASKSRRAAERLLAALQTPAAVALFKAKGLDPAPPSN